MKVIFLALPLLAASFARPAAALLPHRFSEVQHASFLSLTAGLAAGIGDAGSSQPKQKDSYDKLDTIADIFSKVFLGLAGALAGWVAHNYNKRQDQAEANRQKSELKLHQMQTVQLFLPQLLSTKREVEWAALALITAMGEKELAVDVGTWYMSRLLKLEDRNTIESLTADSDPVIADLASRAIKKQFVPKQVTKEPSSGLEVGYRFQTASITPQTEIRFVDSTEEHHGEFVVTRGPHALTLPPEFRISVYLVTNEFFLQFVRDKGYESDEYWDHLVRHKFLSQDGRTLGPGTWASGDKIPDGKEHHPVSGISHHEAKAFCRWLQAKFPSEGRWHWTLPSEDIWELSARSEEGRLYPWGNTFNAESCNYSDTGIGTTTQVNRFPTGRSKCGCFDMAGNVWEFVDATDVEWWSCVLRGGSFRNNAAEVRSSLRLTGVPRDHRPPDFGFRCTQILMP